MKIAVGNLWTFPATWRVITTNGVVRRDGACVMGRGVALQAKRLFPGIEYEIGRGIKEYGNVPYMMATYSVITLPVKHRWDQPADPVLIRQSLVLLTRLPYAGADTVVLPRPGCGNGQLLWNDIRPICEELLNWRFTVIHPAE